MRLLVSRAGRSLGARRPATAFASLRAPQAAPAMTLNTQNTPTMKRLAIILSATFICVSCGVALYPDRGVAVTASVNISAQPPWGPAGYDYAPYYYFPDFNFYYDVDRALFHYYNRGRWIAVRQLPAGYPRDLYKFYKVVIDVRDPWLHNRRHKNIYRKYRGIHTQPVRRDAPDSQSRSPQSSPHALSSRQPAAAPRPTSRAQRYPQLAQQRHGQGLPHRRPQFASEPKRAGRQRRRFEKGRDADTFDRQRRQPTKRRRQERVEFVGQPFDGIARKVAAAIRNVSPDKLNKTLKSYDYEKIDVMPHGVGPCGAGIGGTAAQS